MKKLSKKCKSCNEGYLLFKGKCITYSFKPIYMVNYGEQIVELINPSYYKNIAKIKINNEFINPCINYNFGKNGYPEVYFYFVKDELKSFSYMFSNIIYLYNITLNPYNNIEKITEMNNMFSNDINLNFQIFLIDMLLN